MTNDLPYRIALARVTGVGTRRFERLEQYFGSLDLAWQASKGELKDAGIDDRTATAIVALRAKHDPLAEIDRLVQARVRAIGWHDPAYPERLRLIAAAPPVIFVRGTITAEDDLAIAIVGTRQASPYGKQVAEQLTADLVRQSVTIISGLAKGIDTIAHRAALQGGGRTIAVLGSGLDVIYPHENKQLAERIAESGAVVSDYPLGTKPDAPHFPQRNRIISGLSRGVVVVEAGDRSGATITAGYALDQGRDVFAVPGSIFGAQSIGTNRLIQTGAAKLVARAEDILEELNVRPGQQIPLAAALPDDPTEAAIVRLLSRDPVHIDDLCNTLTLPVAQVSAALAMLELRGEVRHLGGMSYVVSR